MLTYMPTYDMSLYVLVPHVVVAVTRSPAWGTVVKPSTDQDAYVQLG